MNAPRRNRIDLTGQHFGLLTVLRRAEDFVSASGAIRTRWVVRCECGTERVVLTQNLRCGQSQGCPPCVWRKPVDQRLWSHIRKDGPVPSHRPEIGPCWPWTLKPNTYGYGYIRTGHTASSKQRPAHALAYELTVGPIPAGLVLDHLCRNRACCNPSHLEPVTNEENIKRGARARAEQRCA